MMKSKMKKLVTTLLAATLLMSTISSISASATPLPTRATGQIIDRNPANRTITFRPTPSATPGAITGDIVLNVGQNPVIVNAANGQAVTLQTYS